MVGLVGSVALLIFLAFFGVKLLIGFSLLIERIRGGGAPAAQTQQQSILLPPALDPLPDASNSATLTVTGTSEPHQKVILYKNADEYAQTDVSGDGTFRFADIPVDEGAVRFTAKLLDGKGRTSDMSPAVSTTIDRKPPTLTVDSPGENATVNDGTNKVTVNGLTDADARVTINNRVIITRADGSFSYAMRINDGDNTLDIVASDDAGNQTKVTRHVKYQP